MLKLIAGLSHIKRQQGATLMEIMIALAIGLVIMLGMLTVTVANLQSSRQNTQIVRLDQELRAAMDFMRTDIQRAGYWTQAYTNVGQNSNTNPFMVAGSTDINTATAGCILYTYDHLGTGALPAANSGTDDDRYGYRLNGGAIQVRPVSAAFSCTAGNSAWQNLTDPNVINITNLQFTPEYQTDTYNGATLTIREIKISITGNLVGDTSTSRTITESVTVQNSNFS